MNLKPWAATIQQIVEEANCEARDGIKRQVLKAWRRKLEKDATSLSPFQIDEIMREVWSRITRISA